MDEEARKLRRIDNIKEIGFRRRRNETILPSDLTLAGSRNYTPLVPQPKKLGSRLSFSLEGCKEGYYWLSVAVWNFLLASWKHQYSAQRMKINYYYYYYKVKHWSQQEDIPRRGV